MHGTLTLALMWLRNSSEVHDEMEEMRSEYETMKVVPRVTFKELFTNNVLRIPLIISIVVMIGQQFSGINAVSITPYLMTLLHKCCYKYSNNCFRLCFSRLKYSK